MSHLRGNTLTYSFSGLYLHLCYLVPTLPTISCGTLIIVVPY